MTIGSRFATSALAHGVLLLAVLSTGACNRPPPGADRNAALEASSPVATPAVELAELTTADLQRQMRDGTLSSRTITQWYLDRIAAIDDAGPELNAVIEINPDALALAEASDAERRAGSLRGPLHGVPVLLKDNIDTADRMRTSAGSLALIDDVALRDATVAAKLRAAGAIILGKTNLSEWANFRSSNSSSGWSARGGQTRNPYVLDRNPCGSSSGTATAISANLATVGIGTETDGSIVCPSSATGLVGIKPTLGRVSRAGIIPIAASQDTAGPMARTVADAAVVLTAISGPDPRDPAARAPDPAPDFSAHLKADGLAGARIGVGRQYFGFHPEVDAIMERAIQTLRSAGAEIVDPADIPTRGKYDDAELIVLLHEFKAGIADYLATRGPQTRVRTLADLIAFNEREAAREMPWFGQDLFIKAEATTGLDAKEYLEARESARRLAGAEGIDEVLDQHRLDALIAPSGGPAWLTDWIAGDHYGGGSSSAAAVAGYPNITVPAGDVRGLPVGVSFIGGAWSEPRLIELAYAFEQASKARKPPRFLPVASGTVED